MVRDSAARVADAHLAHQEPRTASAAAAVSAARVFVARLQDLVLDLRDASLGEEVAAIGPDLHGLVEAAKVLEREVNAIEDHPDVYQDYDALVRAVLQVRQVNG